MKQSSPFVQGVKHKFLELLKGLGSLIAILFFIVIMDRFFNPPFYRDCSEYHLVKKVGGCDFLGNCGVEFTDGTHGNVHKPTPQQRFCTKTDWLDGENLSGSVKWTKTYESFFGD